MYNVLINRMHTLMHICIEKSALIHRTWNILTQHKDLRVIILLWVRTSISYLMCSNSHQGFQGKKLFAIFANNVRIFLCSNFVRQGDEHPNTITCSPFFWRTNVAKKKYLVAYFIIIFYGAGSDDKQGNAVMLHFRDAH